MQSESESYSFYIKGLPWHWSYGSWIYNYIYAISAYHHWCEFESRSGRGVQHYVIKFVSDLWQVGGFLQVLRFPPPIKLTATIYSTERDMPWSITVIVVMSRRVMGIKNFNSCRWSGGNKTPGVNLVIKCVVLQVN
jgi:hypothetical protein